MTSTTSRTVLGASAALLAAGALGVVTVGGPAHAATHTSAHTPMHAATSAHTAARASTERRAGSGKFTAVIGATTIGGKTGTQVALLHGAINGGGSDKALAQSDVVSLSGGSITIKHPDADSQFHPTVDTSTCYATFTLTGTFTLTHGTGKYHGVTGSGTYAGKGYGYLARKASGGCNMQAAPRDEVFTVMAHGTLD